MDSTTAPILYSFRRCPYAIRARMAILASGHRVVLREVVLRDKPAHMLELSPKGTVPVLLLPDGRVLEESLDIMFWALGDRDPEQWLTPWPNAVEDMLEWISKNDGPFKHHLDRYKYASRYENADALHHRTRAESFLQELDAILAKDPYLYGPRFSLLDAAILPFVRQFANADRAWFDHTPYPHLQKWLATHLQSDWFTGVMDKVPQWHEGDDLTWFPSAP